jgi:phage-related protein
MWTIIFYSKKDNESPIEFFLNSIKNMKLKAKIIREIELLEKFGNKLAAPHTNSIGDFRGALFELRTIQSNNITRIFFFFIKGRRIVLLNGFIKKTNKIPKKELNKAYKYKYDYEKRCKNE